MPIIVSQSPERRWKGTQEGLVCFVVRFLHTSSALLSGFFERQLFVFPSLLRVFLRFASFLLTATAEQHCVARYDLAVSCFLLTVLRHKICCSGCCCCLLLVLLHFSLRIPRSLSVSPLTTLFPFTLGARLHTCCCVCLSA